MSTSRQNLVQDFMTGKIDRRSFVRRALALGVSLSSVEAFVAACTGANSGGGGGTSIKWSNWANTGEIARFQSFTANYNKSHNTNVQYTFVPSANNNYFSKILTELNGGNAPDVFYVGDGDIGKLVANQTVVELSTLLNSSQSKEKATDFLLVYGGRPRLRAARFLGFPSIAIHCCSGITRRCCRMQASRPCLPMYSHKGSGHVTPYKRCLIRSRPMASTAMSWMRGL